MYRGVLCECTVDLNFAAIEFFHMKIFEEEIILIMTAKNMGDIYLFNRIINVTQSSKEVFKKTKNQNNTLEH